MARTRTSPGRAGLGVVATASLVVIALGLLALVVVGLLNVWNPFGTTTVDRSGPAVLDRIRTLEEFTAAEANFTQDVDLESDNFLPGFIKGERVTAIVTGNVRATVDFGDLGPNSVTVSNDGTSIQLTLPEPQLTDPEIDVGSARLVSRDRGIVDLLAHSMGNRVLVGALAARAARPAAAALPVANVILAAADGPVDRAAEKKLQSAARNSDVLDQARTNTEQWLRTFLGAAGFDEITINWAESPN